MSLAINKITHVDEYNDSGICVPYETKAIVVVGTGPVGMHFVYELLKKTSDYAVVVYGGEPWKPYDRVMLSSYLAGDVNRDELELDSPVDIDAEIEMRLNCAVEWIDRDKQTVTDAAGNVQHYAHLVLAVGSSPFLPSIGNLHYEGVFTFRS
jgi:nitrite reductase (NADH) large subunit